MNGNGSQVWMRDKFKVSNEANAQSLFNRLPDTFAAADIQDDINRYVMVLQRMLHCGSCSRADLALDDFLISQFIN